MICKFKVDSWRANITRVANLLASDSDASAIGIFLVWLDFTHNFGVCCLFATIMGGVVVCNDEEGVDVIDAWDQS